MSDKKIEDTMLIDFIRFRRNTLRPVVAKRKSRFRGRWDDRVSPKASTRHDAR